MRRYFTTVLLLLSLTQLQSCGSEPPDAVMHVHNATIKVSVYQQLAGGGGNITNVPINGATIELYATETDREYSMNQILKLTTDSSGNATFTNLKEDYYYLRCLHPVYGTLLDEVSTPDGTLSFVDFVY